MTQFHSQLFVLGRDSQGRMIAVRKTGEASFALSRSAGAAPDQPLSVMLTREQIMLMAEVVK